MTYRVLAPEQGSHIAISVHEEEVDALIDAMHIEVEMWRMWGMDIKTIVNQVSALNNRNDI